MERCCQNCYWYRERPEQIHCLNVDRKDWKPTETSNICGDFVTPEDFVPDLVWSNVVSLIDAKIKRTRK
ncbi:MULTISPECIES: hypothetical protein [Desulfitobacterium]|uniref:hypothetical protein n=1 Tax=Desulfitobacterium TaxID=36853 RepID=UPI000361CB13|nr:MULTISPECIES: hypothetical protein [Desulfitobacterium]